MMTYWIWAWYGRKGYGWTIAQDGEVVAIAEKPLPAADAEAEMNRTLDEIKEPSERPLRHWF